MRVPAQLGRAPSISVQLVPGAEPPKTAHCKKSSPTPAALSGLRVPPRCQTTYEDAPGITRSLIRVLVPICMHAGRACGQRQLRTCLDAQVEEGEQQQVADPGAPPPANGQEWPLWWERELARPGDGSPCGSFDPIGVLLPLEKGIPHGLAKLLQVLVPGHLLRAPHTPSVLAHLVELGDCLYARP